VTTEAFLAVILGTFVPCVFLITLRGAARVPN